MAIPDTLLPQQGAATGAKWSLDRDAQLRSILAAAFEGAIGSGIMSGGVVTLTTGFGAQLAAGTVFFSKGVAYTIATPRALTAPLPSATNYVWWRLTKTAADQTEPTELDTWALSVSYTATNVAPSEDHYPLTNLVCSESAATSVVDPAGKYCGVLRQDESILRDGTRDYLGPQSMNGFALTGLPEPDDDTDATPKGWVVDYVANALGSLDIPGLDGVILASDGPAFESDQSMGNHHLTHVADPTEDHHAPNKAWVVALVGGGAPGSFLLISGDSVMGGNLDLGNHQVVNAADPTTPQALVTLAYLEAALGSLVVTGFLPLAGGTMTGGIDLDGKRITHVPDPTADDHVANRGWTNTRVGTRLPLAGGTMTGAINMDGEAITNLPDPENPQDPATMGWTEAAIETALTTGRDRLIIPLSWSGPPEPSQLMACFVAPFTTYLGGAVTLANSRGYVQGTLTDTERIYVYHRTISGTRTQIGEIEFDETTVEAVSITFDEEVEIAAGELVEFEHDATGDSPITFVSVTLTAEADKPGA